MQQFEIQNNDFLNDGPIMAYYHEEYSPEVGKRDGYSYYIHVLKNTFNKTDKALLNDACYKLFNILFDDISEILVEENFDNETIIIGVPRAQIESAYSKDQLLFRKTISKVANKLGLIDGNSDVVRIKDTKTTHISKEGMILNGKNNDLLADPYPGISRNTCSFNNNQIKGNTIILIDDVYTKTANIAEDFIQALIDLEAKKVVFYSCWYTIR